MIDAHPHIGTNKLPKIVENIRENILKCGGEIHFESRVVDFVISSGKIQSIRLQNDKELDVQRVILATGHSARDIYYLLHRKHIPFNKLGDF